MPRETVRRERMVVRRVRCVAPTRDEQTEGQQLDHDHDVVRGHALARALEQQPCDQHHDAERRQMDDDRNAGDVRRRLQQAVHRRVGAQERRPIAGREPRRKRDAEAAEQRVEVVAPRDRDRDVADGVLEDQIPADDPGDQLSERRVRVGVRASRLRDHRRQLRVAQRRRARTPGQAG